MLYGVSTFLPDYSIPPDEFARLPEERGFESMWMPEHIHIPASQRPQLPGGADLMKEYWHSYDPFIALTAAAMVTTRLKLGTCICLIIQRDPITTAKEVASLDCLSNGRFIFGIGGGWNVQEVENHGTRFKERWRLLRERTLAMKEIWTREDAEFHGDFVNFDAIWQYPKPVQKPHPPILMGGYGPTTFDRVIEFCDGWIPIVRFPEGGASLPKRMAELYSRAEKAGRDPASISISVVGHGVDKAAVDLMEQAGVDRIIFRLPSVEREVVPPLLDQYAALFR